MSQSDYNQQIESSNTTSSLYTNNRFNKKYEDAYKILFKLMQYADAKNASDIFIAPDFPPAIKVHGKLTPLSDKVYKETSARNLVYSILTDQKIDELEQKLELNFAHKATEGVRFRVNAYHEQGRIGMVMRKINTKIKSIDELELPNILKTLAMTPRGMIIVVGATGHGKSTTLAAMVDYRNQNSAGHIITIEDPIEFVHKHGKSIVTQREIGTDTISWHTGLVSAMRQAPDVVVVGEVRDETAMSYAMQLTQTGHLCLCTLHATNSNQALERIINFYDEERYDQLFMDLSLNLVAIVSQRLVNKKDGSGRTVAFDIMLSSPAIKDLVLKGRIDEVRDIMTRSQTEGMMTFDQHLLELYKTGIIDQQEALRNADSVNNIRLAIKLYEEGIANEDDKNDTVFKLDLL